MFGNHPPKVQPPPPPLPHQQNEGNNRLPPPPGGRIRALPPEVFRRIKAGEVIHRPLSCVKELMENSLDAGCKKIVITLNRGGIQYLSVRDDGHGINSDDIELSAQPHTTSKLTVYDDLRNMSTYGFRGEALSSMTYVARVTITSKTADSPVAHRVKFLDGKPIKNSHQQVAGVNGTTIEIEDLFYREQARKNDLKQSKELRLIMNCVIPHALHNSGISFIVNKMDGKGGSTQILRTRERRSVTDNIDQLFTKELAKEITHLTIDRENAGNPTLSWRCECYFTHPNYSQNRSGSGVPWFLLFINNRYVKCRSLRSSVEGLFRQYIPNGTYPFVYLDLKLPPQIVDVNRAVDKSEVGFMHDDVIIRTIQKEIGQRLTNCNQSRTFNTKTQTTLISSSSISNASPPSSSSSSNNRRRNQKNNANPDVRRDYEKVRVEDQLGDLDRYLISSSQKRPLPPATQSNTKRRKTHQHHNCHRMSHPSHQHQHPPQLPKQQTLTQIQSPNLNLEDDDEDDNDDDESESEEEEERKKLTSVVRILEEIENSKSELLTTLFKNHSFIGFVNPEISLIQYEKSMYAIDVGKFSEELVFQKFLHSVKYAHDYSTKQNFPKLRLDNPIPVKKFVVEYMKSKRELFKENREELTKDFNLKFKQLLNARMLSFLNSICQIEMVVDPGKERNTVKLVALPQIVRDHIPPLHRLPSFLYDLIMNGNFEGNSEYECIKSVGRVLSRFFRVSRDYELFEQPKKKDEEEEEEEEEEDQNVNKVQNYDTSTLKWVIKNTLFPLCKVMTLKCPKIWESDRTIIKVADVKQLHKIFERC